MGSPGSPALLLAALSLGMAGCATRPVNRPVVRELQVHGARQLRPEEILNKLATKATATMLGFVLQYETYDRFVLERDLKRIERLYRARGFYDARVQAGRVQQENGDVRIEVLVDEGEPVTVGVLRVDQVTEPTLAAGVALIEAQTIRRGDRFDEDELTLLKQRLLRALSDNGHARARLEGGFTEADMVAQGGRPRVLDPGEGEGEAEAEAPAKAPARKAPREDEKAANKRYLVRVDPVAHRADLFLRVDPGPACTFGAIKLEMPAQLPEERVRVAMGLKPGDPYSLRSLELARRALLDLGLFASVEYSADVGVDSTAIPVVFKMTPSPLRVFTVGGGLQIDTLQGELHGLAGYEHQNFLGGLRRLTFQLRPGVVMFPTNLQNLLPPERALPDVTVRTELRQPQFLDSKLWGTLRADFAIYPFLLPARSSVEVPDVVVGYRELRGTAGLDRKFRVADGTASLGASYSLQRSDPFSYIGPLDQGIRSVLISYISLVQTLDLRDNPIKPRLGLYLSNEIQIAGTPTNWLFSSDARDVRIQPDARFYAPITRWLVVATRGSLGFLFPKSYGDTLDQAAPDRAIDQIAAFTFEEARNRDLQLLYFRAFFSGGPTSNRGYALRGVGPRGIAPFRLGGATALRDCVGRTPASKGVGAAATLVARLPEVDPLLCSVSLGGLSLWEWSGELRFSITDSIGFLLFTDASDVTRKQFALRLSYPHLTVGAGLRLDTPVGPVRLDVGHAVNGLQRIGGDLDPNTEGQPATLLGLPLSVNIAVGEAF